MIFSINILFIELLYKISLTLVLFFTVVITCIIADIKQRDCCLSNIA